MDAMVLNEHLAHDDLQQIKNMAIVTDIRAEILSNVTPSNITRC